jgi:hypothetical protein
VNRLRVSKKEVLDPGVVSESSEKDRNPIQAQDCRRFRPDSNAAPPAGCSMPYRLEGNQPEKPADALLAEG